MRTALYIVTLLAGVWALRIALGYQLHPVPYGLYISNFGPIALLLVRGVIWYKRGRVASPASFNGIPFFIACSLALLLLATFGLYGVLASTGASSGLSGVPLGLLLVVLSGILVLLVPFIEVRDWIAFRNERHAGRSTSQA